MCIMYHDITAIINDVLETIVIIIEDNNNNSNKKTVTINENYNTVFIIQSIDNKEYYHNKYDIWWSSIDIFHFKLFAKNELLYFIDYHKINSNVNLSAKDALTLLYQP